MPRMQLSSLLAAVVPPAVLLLAPGADAQGTAAFDAGLAGPTEMPLDSCGSQNALLHANADALLAILDKVTVIETELEALAADANSLNQTLGALEEVSRNGPGADCRLVGSGTSALDWQDGGLAEDGVSQVIFTVVDTSSFAFAANGFFIPAYIASLQFPASSINSIGSFAFGQSQILGASTSSFRFVVSVDPNLFGNPTDPTDSSYTLLQLARDSQWSVRWTANAGRCSQAGQAYDWEQYEANGLRMRVDTTAARFSSTPSYVISLGGDQHDTSTTFGVYGKQRDEFYVYVETNVTAANASAYNWHINWIGKEASDGTDFFRDTSHAAGTAMAWAGAGADTLAAGSIFSTQVEQVLAPEAVMDWFRVYKDFVIVTTLSGRTQEEQAIGWSCLNANSDGTFTSKVRPTSSWLETLSSSDNPAVTAASAGWRLDWIAVPI
eukprot:SAG22_NODE_2436_length_2576_cov_1.368187_2_plen_439_part_00